MFVWCSPEKPKDVLHLCEHSGTRLEKIDLEPMAIKAYQKHISTEDAAQVYRILQNACGTGVSLAVLPSISQELQENGARQGEQISQEVIQRHHATEIDRSRDEIPVRKHLTHQPSPRQIKFKQEFRCKLATSPSSSPSSTDGVIVLRLKTMPSRLRASLRTTSSSQSFQTRCCMLPIILSGYQTGKWATAKWAISILERAAWCAWTSLASTH